MFNAAGLRMIDDYREYNFRQFDFKNWDVNINSGSVYNYENSYDPIYFNKVILPIALQVPPNLSDEELAKFPVFARSYGLFKKTVPIDNSRATGGLSPTLSQNPQTLNEFFQITQQLSETSAQLAQVSEQVFKESIKDGSEISSPKSPTVEAESEKTSTSEQTSEKSKGTKIVKQSSDSAYPGMFPEDDEDSDPDDIYK